MTDTNKCETCPVHNAGNLKKLGINMDKFDYVIALAGNPNTGKSTVFNSLTGLKQHTGNWPGKTVTRAEGGFEFNSVRYKLIDLPGTYSLLSTSTDEEIARDFILFGQPDVTIIVVDATRLERNLNLVLQVLEITDRAIICLNLMDEARRRDIEIDVRALSRELGIPVIPTEARYGKGIQDLLSAVDDIVSGRFVCKPYRITGASKGLMKAVENLSRQIKNQFSSLPNSRWIALRLLEGDQRIIDAIRSGDISNIVSRNSYSENPATALINEVTI
jgi:Fe2+ transport system protein B